MSEDRMRMEFEVWIAERIANNGVSHWLKRKPSGDMIDNCVPYKMTWVEAAWQGWQASRAALVVELPQTVGYEGQWDAGRDSELSTDWADFQDADVSYALARKVEVKEAIESAGVRVKP